MHDLPVNPPSVLIAEDQFLIGEALRRELERKSFNVVANVRHGQEAVDTVEKLHPDIVLLDISMPVMDGFEAAERIAEAVPEAKVIFVSSHAEPEYVEKAFRRGARGYVLKGRIAELYQAIRAVLDGQLHRPEFIS